MTEAIEQAYILDGPNGGRAVPGAEIASILKEETIGWVHLAAAHPETEAWIESQLDYLDPTITDALLAEETRPRFARIGDGALVILRGINTLEGADPEDMVSLRLWIDASRVITVSRRYVRAVDDVAATLDAGEGPRDAGSFLALLAERLNNRINEFGGMLDDRADDLEEQIIGVPIPEMRKSLVELRMQAIRLRRHGLPQREALSALTASSLPWLSSGDVRRLHEVHDSLSRMIEDMDAMRERTSLLREELAGQLSDRLNRNMYLLSILSALFLPLGFLTGLFGINLAGMPGAQSPLAFWLFTAGLVAVAGFQMLLLRRMRWI